MLVFIGLGLSKRGISLRGLDEVKESDRVFAEFYTSLIPQLELGELEETIGKSITTLSRKEVEQKPDEVLDVANGGKAAFLVPGDPMVATTHVDLRLRAKKRGIETKVVHGASIETAAPGLAGLQSYKFGRSVTLPFPEKPSETPYEVLQKNQESGLHTLFLLDIRAEEGEYLRANEGIRYLFNLEEKFEEDVFTEETLLVVAARAGAEDSLVRGDRAVKLMDEDFGPPPHVLIVPGKLHFMEAEALKVFADAPEGALENNVKE